MRLSRRMVAIAVYAAGSTLSALVASQNGRPVAVIAVALVPVAFFFRARPIAMLTTLVVGGTILRLAFYGVLDADGIAISQGAFNAVLSGGNPYAQGYAVSIPPGAPFVYGPLALLTAIPGPWVEFLAGVATMAVMGYVRSSVALAIYATAPLVTTMTMSGTNDVLPGLLIAAGLLALRSPRPWVGAVLISVSAAIKPYGFAWYPAIVALGGVPALAALVVVTAIAWSPLLVWGLTPFLDAVEKARAFHLVPENAMNIPEWRPIAAIPWALSLFSRSWLAGVLLGAAVFVLVLFLDRWASISYWLALAPILLIAGEETAAGMWDRSRDRRPAPVQRALRHG